MGGLRVTPDIALADLRPEDSAMPQIHESASRSTARLSVRGPALG